MNGGKDVPSTEMEESIEVVPLPPELIEQGIKTWDESSLKQGEVDEPLKLLALDQSIPRAKTRIGTKLNPRSSGN